MYSEGPLVTSYEAMITVTTSDGSDFPLSVHFEHSIIMNHLHSYVAIPDRNQTLFHYTFWLCYHTRCAVVHTLFHYTFWLCYHTRCAVVHTLFHYTFWLCYHTRCAVVHTLFHYTFWLCYHTRCAVVHTLFHYTFWLCYHTRCAVVHTLFHYTFWLCYHTRCAVVHTLFHYTFWLCYHTRCAVVHSLVPHGLGMWLCSAELPLRAGLILAEGQKHKWGLFLKIPLWYVQRCTFITVISQQVHPLPPPPSPTTPPLLHPPWYLL